MASDRSDRVQELARAVVLLGQAIAGPQLSRDSVLKVTALAEQVGVNPSTVRLWIKRTHHPLPAWQPRDGGSVLVRWGDFLDWLEPLNTTCEVERAADEALLRLAGTAPSKSDCTAAATDATKESRESKTAA